MKLYIFLLNFLNNYHQISSQNLSGITSPDQQQQHYFKNSALQQTTKVEVQINLQNDKNNNNKLENNINCQNLPTILDIQRRLTTDYFLLKFEKEYADSISAIYVNRFNCKNKPSLTIFSNFEFYIYNDYLQDFENNLDILKPALCEAIGIQQVSMVKDIKIVKKREQQLFDDETTSEIVDKQRLNRLMKDVEEQMKKSQSSDQSSNQMIKNDSNMKSKISNIDINKMKNAALNLLQESSSTSIANNNNLVNYRRSDFRDLLYELHTLEEDVTESHNIDFDHYSDNDLLFYNIILSFYKMLENIQNSLNESMDYSRVSLENILGIIKDRYNQYLL